MSALATLSAPVTTLSVFHFPPGLTRLRVFLQMSTASLSMRGTTGLRFRRVMGTGQKFGSPRPDWSRWVILGVWDSERAARAFLAKGALPCRWRRLASASGTVFLEATKAHGAWGRANPFRPTSAERDTGPLAVLTRGSVRPSLQLTFFRSARLVDPEIRAAEGLSYLLPFGELPIFRQGTFSLWSSLEAMQRFAYGAPDHQRAIRLTREKRWYSEDLFARFRVLGFDGALP